MALDTWFKCIGNCSGKYAIFDIIYRCPECGGLLEVVHDLSALKKRCAEDWKKSFDARSSNRTGKNGSGVWSKKEWVLPNVDDANIVTMAEGNNPLLETPRLADAWGLSRLWIKQCGTTHTGSFKDLGMTALVSVVQQIVAEGGPVQAVACASTGDTSAALSAYGAAAGIPTIVFLPANKVSPAQLVQPLANGALVLALETDFDGCMKVVVECTRKGGVYLANSMNSLRVEGQKTVAFELVQQLNWTAPDWIVIPGGNLGNVSALGKGLRLMLELGVLERKPRILVAQAEAANPLYLSYQSGFDHFESKAAQPTLASAIRIGDPVSVQKAIKELRFFDGAVEQASEQELVEAMATADRAGMFTCPQTGVALAALKRARASGTIPKGAQVALISTAHGLKFAESKTRYHLDQLEGLSATSANQPRAVAADVSKVQDEIQRYIDSIGSA
jgi:threonine synthase